MQIPIFRGGGCVKLIDVCNPKQWKTISASELVEDGYPVFGANGIIGYFSDYNHEKPTLCITCRGATCGTVNKSLPYSYITGNSMALDDLDESVITIDFLYYFLQYRGFDDVITGSAQPQITRQSLSKIFIPEIDLNIQKNITQIIKSLEQLILNRDKQRENFNMLVKSRFNEMFGDPVLNEMCWDKHALKEFGIWKSGGTPKRNEKEFFRGNIPWITSGELEHKYIEDSFEKISEKAIECSSAKIIEKGSLLLGMYDTAGLKSSINTKVMSCNQAIAFAKLDDKITNTIYVYYVIQNLRSMLLNQQRGVRQKNFNLSKIKNISIPLPPLSLQNEFADFVAQVDKSQFACQMAIKLWRNSLKSSII